jgi:hypothetical protein
MVVYGLSNDTVHVFAAASSVVFTWAHWLLPLQVTARFNDIIAYCSEHRGVNNRHG